MTFSRAVRLILLVAGVMLFILIAALVQGWAGTN